MVFRLLVLFSLVLSAQARPIAHQYVLIFKTAEAAKAFRTPEHFRRVRAFERYVVLYAVSGDETAEIGKLKKNPGIEAITEDERVKLQADVATVDGAPPAAPAGTSMCSMGKYCLKAKRDLDWDEQLANIDLMNKEVGSKGINTNSVRVGLVDSGVDPAVATALAKEGVVHWADGYGHEDSTAIMHGTMSAERILWAAPGTTVDSFGVYDANHSADASAVVEATYKACRRGDEIINLSIEPAAPERPDPGEVT